MTVPKAVLSDRPLGCLSPDQKSCAAAGRFAILKKVRITPW